METSKRWREKIRRFFIPPSKDSIDAFKEITPFFILITVVLVGMYVLTLSDSTLMDDPLRLVGFSLLYFIHMLLYWTVLHFAQNERRTLYYTFVQGFLAFALVLISRNANIVIALYATLAGNTVGMLGKNWVTIFGVIFYAILGFFSILLVSDFDSLRLFFPILLASIGFSAFFAYSFFVQIEARVRTENLLNDLEEAHQQLAEYALEVENLTITNERQRMARDLHDTLAQGLAGLILQLEAANIHIEEKRVEKTQEILQQALSRARSTLVDARRAIDDLRFDSSNPRHLAEGITREVTRFNNATGIPCKLLIDLPGTLSDEVSEHVFRTVSEGLGNIARHAQANQASVEISQADDHLNLRIWDDGAGFNPDEEMARAGHYGLLGIRERARLAGGTLNINSSPGNGTRIDLSLPTGVETNG
ncbi:MAG: sensor histidine kinase [Anaerolineales bacterium]|jgi:NarL family two-component system sensor histidine kinase YdfH